MTPKKEREYYIKTLSCILNTNINIFQYYKELAKTEKDVKTCNKTIRQSKKGLKMLPNIKRIEILRDFFERFIYGKESYFVLSGSLCSYKKINYWDRSEKGFKDFLEWKEMGIKQQQEKIAEQQRNAEIIKKAQEQGKKVEMLYDSETKKIKPVIVDKKESA